MVGRILIILFCVLVSLPVSAADGLWEWVTPLPQGHDLLAAAVGDGVAVAVGQVGTVITSADGSEWRTSRTGAEYWLMDVVWGNGLFVAVGGETRWDILERAVVLTSNDGVNWVERYRSDQLVLEAVTWTGSQFVAVGIADRALLSADGISWSEQQLGPDAWEMIDIAWNGSMLVAVGYDNVPAFGRPSYFTSKNGEAWQVQNFECEYCSSNSIAAIDGRFVAVGSWRKVLVSDDGTTWNEAPCGISGDLDRFLATGYGIVGTSIDGYTWSIEELSIEARVHGLAWGGNGYLAVGDDGFMMSSADGSVWTQLSVRSFDVGSSSWEIDELAIGDSAIVGVGAGIIRSRRGVEWVWHPSPGDSGPVSVIWTGSAFWAVGRYGVIRSTDGVDWAQMLVDREINLFDIVWNGSLFVAVGWNPSSGDGRKLILISPDGLNWSYQWFDREDHFFAVGWAGSRFVVAGSGPQYLTSTDGVDW